MRSPWLVKLPGRHMLLYLLLLEGRCQTQLLGYISTAPRRGQHFYWTHASVLPLYPSFSHIWILNSCTLPGGWNKSLMIRSCSSILFSSFQLLASLTRRDILIYSKNYTGGRVRLLKIQVSVRDKGGHDASPPSQFCLAIPVPWARGHVLSE